MNQIRPCPACRGYALEARWCHVCNGRGVFEVSSTENRTIADLKEALWRLSAVREGKVNE